MEFLAIFAHFWPFLSPFFALFPKILDSKKSSLADESVNEENLVCRILKTVKIVKTVKNTGAIVTGPIPLPTHKKIFTVLRSPHVNKKSREQFKLCSYKRLLDIYSSSSKTVDALMKLELPSGVEVEIKV